MRRPMRRYVASVLLTAGASVVVVAGSAGPAAAHICPGAAEVPVGQPHTIQVLVRIEQQPVASVDLTLPAAVQLNRVDPKPGWTSTRQGTTVHYRGGPFTPFTCEYFSMGVTAAPKGVYPIHVVTRAPDGTVAIDSASDPSAQNDPNFSPIVYAGTLPPAPSSSGGGGVSFVTIAGVALVALGVGLIVFLAIRSRRIRKEDEREDELQARVDEVRKRTSSRQEPEEQ